MSKNEVERVRTVFSDVALHDVKVLNPINPEQDIVGGKVVKGVFNDPRALTLAKKYLAAIEPLTREEADVLFNYLNDEFFPAIGGCPKSIRLTFFRRVSLLPASELVARTFEGT